MKYSGSFKLYEVLQAIRLNINQKCTEKEYLFLFLQIDEFQKIFQRDSQLEGRTENDERTLFHHLYLLSVLGGYMRAKPSMVYVQTLLSGTAPFEVIQVLEPSGYSCKPLSLPLLLLSLKSRIELMKYYADQGNSSEVSWESKIWVHQLLLDTGGLPHALDTLFIEFFGEIYENIVDFFNNIESHQPVDIFHRVMTNLDNH
ncbi:6969_t:CDS:1, partial [Paraglomus occultum]